MKKILIIEDDKLLRQVISRKLSTEGFEVIEAEDGEQGLIKTKEQKPDLVLLDLILPSIDGFEVLEKVKKDPETSSVKVVILSNLGQEEEIDKGFSLGATDYLVKANFTPGEIVNKVKEILAK